MTLGNQDTELTQGAVGTVQVPSLCALVEQADRVPGVIHLCPVHLLSLSLLSLLSESSNTFLSSSSFLFSLPEIQMAT